MERTLLAFFSVVISAKLGIIEIIICTLLKNYGMFIICRCEFQVHDLILCYIYLLLKYQTDSVLNIDLFYIIYVNASETSHCDPMANVISSVVVTHSCQHYCTAGPVMPLVD